MTFVRFSSRAQEQVRVIEAWWEQHRSTELFSEELASAIERLTANPLAGPPHPLVGGIRRVLLRRSRYRLYYRFEVDRDRVQVLAVWHTSRGREPKLR